MDAAKGREPVAPGAAKVVVQAFVGVDAKELADALDRQDLTVGQDRVGAALAQPPASQPLVDQAVHRDEQRRSIHGRPRTRGDSLITKRTGVTTHQNPHTGSANPGGRGHSGVVVLGRGAVGVGEQVDRHGEPVWSRRRDPSPGPWPARPVGCWARIAWWRVGEPTANHLAASDLAWSQSRNRASSPEAPSGSQRPTSSVTVEEA